MLRILKHIWSDIQQGENIDLYVTVVIAITLALLSIVGIAPQSLIEPITITVLALFAISLLVNRRKLEFLLQQFGQKNQLVFLEEFPPTLKSDIERCQELWMVGINLNETIPRNEFALKKKLKEGGTIKILLMNPAGEAIITSVNRTKRYLTYDKARSRIEETLDSLCSMSGNEPVKLEIRTVDYPLPFLSLIHI